jgi:hypothetical protein
MQPHTISMRGRLMVRDPSLPPVPLAGDWLAETCTCLKPILQDRAERRGAARRHCARCGRELPLRFGVE